MGRANLRRLALVAGLALLVVASGAYFLSCQLVIWPLHATATVLHATALGDQTVAAETAIAAKSTAAADQTQQAGFLRGTAGAQETRAAADQTQVAISATQVAATQIVADKCTVADRYTLEVSAPTLHPPAGTTYILGNPPFDIYATWTVRNTGECPWNNVRLRVLSGTGIIPQVADRTVQPGESVELAVHFPFSGAGDVDRLANVTGDWFLVVQHPRQGDLLLLDQPHLVLAVEGWIVPVVPTSAPTYTPTPTPTPTHTPTPTSTPTNTPVPTVCSEVCKECKECVQYQDPNDPSSDCLRWRYYACPPCQTVCGTPTPRPD